jgi:hypothetical protein
METAVAQGIFDPDEVQRLDVPLARRAEALLNGSN